MPNKKGSIEHNKLSVVNQQHWNSHLVFRPALLQVNNLLSSVTFENVDHR
jgi:hypothetical protein